MTVMVTASETILSDGTIIPAGYVVDFVSLEDGGRRFRNTEFKVSTRRPAQPNKVLRKTYKGLHRANGWVHKDEVIARLNEIESNSDDWSESIKHVRRHAIDLLRELFS